MTIHDNLQMTNIRHYFVKLNCLHIKLKVEVKHRKKPLILNRERLTYFGDLLKKAKENSGAEEVYIGICRASIRAKDTR